MTEVEGEITFTEPAYATDEKKKDGFVYVIVSVKTLGTSRTLTRDGLVPKMVREASNATVTVEFENQGFCLTVLGESGDMKYKNFKLNIKKLPYEIDSDASYHKVEDNRVLLYLKKIQNKSWYPQLQNGLETAEDEEEGEGQSVNTETDKPADADN